MIIQATVYRRNKKYQSAGRIRRTRGIALVSVLWVVALLSIVALGVSSEVRTETRSISNLLQLTQAQYAAEGGVDLAIANLFTSSPARWPVDGTVQKVRIAKAAVRIAIYDETGRIDLNYAEPWLLNKLLASANLGAHERLLLVDAILDWRDSDNLRLLYGAEDYSYFAAGMPYGAKDAKFDNVDELGLILGMRPEIVQAIKPVLTVYSGRAGVDSAVASAQVLSVLSGSGSDGLEQDGERLGSPPAQESHLQNSARAAAEFSGSFFSIHVEARIDAKIVARVAATVQLIDARNRYRIVAWSQPFDADFAYEAPEQVAAMLNPEWRVQHD